MMTEDEINRAFGNRIRTRRRLLEMTQTALAVKVGVSFQQIQKYEAGGVRLAGSFLLRLASALKVPITYFYEGLEDAVPLPQALPKAA